MFCIFAFSILCCSSLIAKKTFSFHGSFFHFLFPSEKCFSNYVCIFVFFFIFQFSPTHFCPFFFFFGGSCRVPSFPDKTKKNPKSNKLWPLFCSPFSVPVSSLFSFSSYLWLVIVLLFFHFLFHYLFVSTFHIFHFPIYFHVSALCSLHLFFNCFPIFLCFVFVHSICFHFSFIFMFSNLSFLFISFSSFTFFFFLN